MKRRAKITALGRYVPPRVVTNKDLAQMVDTNDEWIVERTGISERHWVEPGTPTSELAARAASDLLQQRGIEADEIEMIIVVTVTPDMFFPATACLVQDKIGARRAWGFDLSAACSGFLYGLTVGAQFIESGAHTKVMVIGADVMTSILNPQDRATLILFGDAAGAVLLEPSEDENVGLLDYLHEVDGSGGPSLCMPGGGSLNPSSHDTVEKRMHYVHQQGPAVFKFAVRKMEELGRGLLERNQLKGNDLGCFIAHQANIRIIDAASEKLGLAPEKVIKNIHKYGNTTAGTIPLAIGDAIESGRLKKGDLVMFAAVGAGFTAGSALVRWAY
ncbi:MAG: ketoacyl-ACP synthase III [Acidobacteria bacterium]|nr:ketoacyl-ACP synthase III [Acidobacteriota bacterium]MCW5968985.1 ketoacyl-ACP synthase III [Blastocatellales bacterium]